MLAVSFTEPLKSSKPIRVNAFDVTISRSIRRTDRSAAFLLNFTNSFSVIGIKVYLQNIKLEPNRRGQNGLPASARHALQNRVNINIISNILSRGQSPARSANTTISRARDLSDSRKLRLQLVHSHAGQRLNDLHRHRREQRLCFTLSRTQLLTSLILSDTGLHSLQVLRRRGLSQLLAEPLVALTVTRVLFTQSLNKVDDLFRSPVQDTMLRLLAFSILSLIRSLHRRFSSVLCGLCILSGLCRFYLIFFMHTSTLLNNFPHPGATGNSRLPDQKRNEKQPRLCELVPPLFSASLVVLFTPILQAHTLHPLGLKLSTLTKQIPNKPLCT
uniref:Uncharacterized protein n=1 Tax=Phage sp. ctesc4 TaxID=2828008 RepID=A0A8S5TCR7_9VIRU|nr:MAG TPA: hypothetical protein [Phage sp. ctesc4]